MKIIKCYNCGCEENTFYIEDNGFSLVKCSECGLLFVRNPPNEEQIKQALKQGIHHGNETISVTGRLKKEVIPKYTRMLRDIYKGDFGQKKMWLDIGCGYGEFMIAIKKYSAGSIYVKGNEPNIIKQKSAQKRGLDVSYFDIDLHQDKYDIISLLNVYSHLPDPPEFLNSMKQLLNPEGEILIETGDIAKFSPEDQVKLLNLPDHLSFASEKILVDILERLNFKILCIKKYPYRQFNIITFIKELIKLFLPQYKSRIKYFFLKKYSENDMFIRAVLKN